VSSLRSLSRGDEERRTPLDVRCAVAVAARMTANELRFRARLETTLDPVPLVDADEGRLGQVFINLLVNAAQAMSQGAIADNVIRIVTRTDAEGRAVIEVHDNGPGISAEVCRRIFDPFFTTKPVGAGTGLGLSICHGIVTSLGGTIVVTSEVGVGSCFRVTLPASSTAGSTPRSPSAIDQSRAPPARPARRARILVIDDDQLVAQTTARSLRDHDVVVVNDGKTAAARLVAGERFDVIVCDLMMPGMTGMDVHATLAEAQPAIAKRMIFMTGGASDASAQSFLERTSNPRLAKPFQGADLRAAVEKMLG
jgi:CheY-like chemotaxis protein